MSEHGINRPEESIEFSPEQMELIREGDESFERGEAFTPQEVLDMARKRTRAWLHADQSHTA